MTFNRPAALLALITCFAAAPAAAVPVISAIAGQNVVAGTALPAVRVTVTSVPNGTTITWRVFQRLGSCSGPEFPVPPGLKLLRSISTVARGVATNDLNFAAALTAQAEGSMPCTVVEACDDARSCAQSTFAFTVTRSTTDAARMIAHDDTLLGGDPASRMLALYGRQTALQNVSFTNEVLELVSCPTTTTCAPPALPPWINSNPNRTDRFNVEATPPSSAAGNWVFRASLPTPQGESEPNNTVTTADPVRAGAVFVGSSNAEADFWGLNLVNAQAVTVAGIPGLCTGGTVAITNSAGVVLATSTTVASPACPSVTFTPTTTAAHFIRVIGQNAATYAFQITGGDPVSFGSTNFTVKVNPAVTLIGAGFGSGPFRTAIEDEPANNSFATAPDVTASSLPTSPLSIDGAVLGQISPAGDVDLYRLHPEALLPLDIRTTGRDGVCPGDTLLRLISLESGVPVVVAQNDDDVDACSHIRFDPPTNAILYAEVSHRDGDATIADVLVVVGQSFNEVERNLGNDTLFSTAQQSDGAYSPSVGRLEVGDPDVTSIHLNVGDLLDSHALAVDGACDGTTTMEIHFDPASGSCGFPNPLFVNNNLDGSCGGVEDFVAPCTGTYDLRLTGSFPDRYLWDTFVYPANIVAPSIANLDTTFTAPQTVTYGSCSVTAGSFSATAATDFGVYDATAALPAATCDADATSLRDGDGVCRNVGARLPGISITGFNQVPLVEGVSQIGVGFFFPVVEDRALHIVAHQDGRSDATGLHTAGGNSIISVHGVTGGNEILYDLADECSLICRTCRQGFEDTTGCVTSPVERCEVGTSLGVGGGNPSLVPEGTRFQIALRRHSRLDFFTSSTAAQKCTSLNGTGCTALPPEATLNGTNLQWDIPYNTTPGQHFFRVQALANAARGEPLREFYVVVTVADRAGFTGTGPDLYPASTRLVNPRGFASPDSRLLVQFGGNAGGHNTPVSRTLVSNDEIAVNGVRDTTFEVVVKNQGNAVAPAGNIDAFFVDGVVDSQGVTTFPPPTASTPPTRSVAFASLAANTTATINVPVRESDFVSHLPGIDRPRALYLRTPSVAGELVANQANNLIGPIKFSTELRDNQIFHGSTDPDASGFVTVTAPPTVVEGTIVNVTATASLVGVTQDPPPAPQLPIQLRFYANQPTEPSAATAFTQQVFLEPGFKSYAATFAAAKPDNATNTLAVRAFLDATNFVVESSEVNNHLPSRTTTLPVVVTNTPPAFGATPARAVNEDQLLSFSVTATDANVVDRARLAVSIVSAPAGLALGSPTLSGPTLTVPVTFTPTGAQAGVNAVTLRVCDGDPVAGGAGACVDTSFNITVTAVDDKPVINPLPPPSIAATEDSVSSFVVNASDEEGDALEFVVVGASPPGVVNIVNVGANARRVDYTPNDTAVGFAQQVTLRVREVASPTVFADAVINFGIVGNVNDAPVVGAPSATAATEGVAFVSDLAVTDADVDISGRAQTFTCALIGAPAWLSTSLQAGPRRCRLSGTPGNGDVGTANLTVRVSDGVVSVDRAVSLSIANVNQAPTLSGPAITAATQGVLFTGVVTASDLDLAAPGVGEVLTFFKDAGPAAMTLTPSTSSATLTWTPSPSDVNPATHPVTIRVRDAAGAEAIVSFNVVVANVNDAPVLADPADATIIEGATFTTTLTATDADAAAGLVETLTFSIVSGAPSGMTINAASGLISLGATNDAQVGIFDVAVRVVDAAGAQGNQTFRLTVTNVEEDPVLGALANENTNEDAPYTRTIVATDPDNGATLTYSLTASPAGMTIGAASGVITFAPQNANVGANPVTVRVVDNTGRAVTRSYVLTVVNVNDAPTITSTAVTTVNEDAVYTYTLVANDVDVGDTLTFSAVTLPAWLSFNTTTRVLTGVPQNADVGTHSVRLRVGDGTVNVDQAFSVVVSNTNDAPVLAAIGNKSVLEGATLSIALSATDPDPGASTLTFSIVGVPPPGSTLNASTGAFSWTTTASDVGSRNVTFRVSDGSATDEETITVTVGDVNGPPSLALVGDRVVSEGNTLTVTLSATDPDVGDVLTFQALGDVAADPFAAGATFNAPTKTFTFPTAFDDAGVYFVTFVVSDGVLVDNELVQITVTDVNRAPVFTFVDDLTADEDAVYALTATATDADADTLNWSLPVKPTTMTINATTGAIAWTPRQADVGNANVTVRVIDGRGGQVDRSFVIVVANVNDAPVFTSTPTTTAAEDIAFTSTFTATDEDPATTLTFSAPTKPAWLAFNATTRVLSGTPAQSDVGSHNVVVRVSDGVANVDQAFTVVVAAVNDAPVFVAPTPSGTVNGSEGQLLTFTVAATDVDSASLTFSMTGLPVGATLNATTGAFAWTPLFTDSGTRNVTLNVTDGALTTTQALTLAIANVDRAPTLAAPATITGSEGVELSYVVTAADADNDAITLSLVAPTPAGATLVGSTVRYTPSFVEAGTLTFRVRATANGQSVDKTTVATIADVNRNPTVTSTPPTLATEDQLLTYAVVATDPDADAVSFAFVGATNGATLNATTGAFAFTPTGAQVGSRLFTIRVSDGRGGVFDHVFSVVVGAVNDAPIVTSVAPTTATEDLAFSYQVTATDEENDVIAFTLPTAPPGMTINATGLVRWTPQNSDVGSRAVVVRLDDAHGGVVNHAFTLVVQNVNDAPTFTSAPPLSVAEDATYVFTPTTADVDAGDVVTVTLVTGPVGATFTGGTLRFTPSNADVGVVPFRLNARDLSGGSTDLAFNVTVVNTNDAPFFVSAPINATVAEGDLFVVNVSASDVDANDVVSFSLVGAPGRASIDSSGAFSFTPDDAEVGVHDFTVRATDVAGASANLAAHIVVTPVNDAPVLAAIGNQRVDIDATLTFTLAASDAENTPLTFIVEGVGEPLPSGASLVGNRFTWTPGVADAGPHNLLFKVTDGALLDSEEVVVVVGDGGLPPALVVPADAVIDEGSLLSRAITASDPETDDPVAVTATGLPVGATFDGASFRWTPAFTDAGVFTVVFEAQNASGRSRRSWNITVRDVNRAPVFDGLPPSQAREGDSYVGSVAAHDDDGDVVTFALVAGPPGLTIAANGAIAWTPTFDDAGSNTALVRASDGRGATTTESFVIVVAFIDDDADLLPDSWELLVGTDPTVNDAALDPDRDGLSNLDEFRGDTDPFVSNAPPSPTLLDLADGQRTDTATPTLLFSDVDDPDGDAVSYAVRVFVLATGDVVFANEVADTDVDLAVDVDVALDEGVAYGWDVVATDGIGFSAPATGSFVVDAVNSPPPAPRLVSPPDDARVSDATPTLFFDRVVDEDGDDVTYAVRVKDGAFGNVIVEGNVEDVAGALSFTVPDALTDGARVFWEVSARDGRGGQSTSSPRSFVVDTTGRPPSAPSILFPLDGAIVNTADVTLRFAPGVDPDNGVVVHNVEVASDAGFSDAVAFDGIAAVAGEVRIDLVDRADGAVFWRIVATDGAFFSDVVSGSFVIDSVDDPPGVPTLQAPADAVLLDNQRVVLEATPGVDPEGGSVAVRFELVDDNDGVIAAHDVDADNDGVARFDDVFSVGVHRWRARSVEPDGPTSAPTATRLFRVEVDNVRPEAPLLLEPTEGSTVTTATPVLRFAAAIDADGDSVSHAVAVRDEAGVLVFSADGLVASGEGLVDVALVSPLENGAFTWEARGRDRGGFGAASVGTFTVDVAAEGEGEGEGEGDVGEGEGDVVGEGEGEGSDLPPVQIPVGDPLKPLAPSCNCQTTSPSVLLPGAPLLALMLLRRRRVGR